VYKIVKTKRTGREDIFLKLQGEIEAKDKRRGKNIKWEDSFDSKICSTAKFIDQNVNLDFLEYYEELRQGAVTGII
jgi:hypothetical protein